MNIKQRTSKQQLIINHLIRVLAENDVTYNEAPSLLDAVNDDLRYLCKQ